MAAGEDLQVVFLEFAVGKSGPRLRFQKRNAVEDWPAGDVQNRGVHMFKYRVWIVSAVCFDKG